MSFAFRLLLGCEFLIAIGALDVLGAYSPDKRSAQLAVACAGATIFGLAMILVGRETNQGRLLVYGVAQLLCTVPIAIYFMFAGGCLAGC